MVEKIKSPEIEKIVLHLADGTTKEINKGFIANMNVDEAEQQATMTFHMVHISGTEMRYVVESMVEFGYKAGYFGEDENDG